MKLTKKKASSFYKSLLGHASGMELDDSGVAPTYEVAVGKHRYMIWMYNGRILLHIILNCSSIGMYYFDPETFEYDYEFTERIRKE
jgi:hypothetical protein